MQRKASHGAAQRAVPVGATKECCAVMLLSASGVNGTEAPPAAATNLTDHEAAVLEATTGGWDATSLAYVFVPLSLVVCLGLATALVVFLVRKSRLDRLRHHLMPFYSFDPQDEGEDWEAELLEEGLTHRPNPANKNQEFHEPPKLAFRSVL